MHHTRIALAIHMQTETRVHMHGSRSSERETIKNRKAQRSEILQESAFRVYSGFRV